MGPRDVDLGEWKNGITYQPADTLAKLNGHVTVRALIADIGQKLHEILPPGRDKSLVFTGLEDILMRANRSLAIGGGPQADAEERCRIVAADTREAEWRAEERAKEESDGQDKRSAG